jgi:hypothetical protein
MWNIEAIRACEVWALLPWGYTGDGIVVGIVNWGILHN